MEGGSAPFWKNDCWRPMGSVEAPTKNLPIQTHGNAMCVWCKFGGCSDARETSTARN